MDRNCQKRLFAAFKVCLLAGATSWMMPSTAMAQLRTGRTPRTVYNQNIKSDIQKPQEATSVDAAEDGALKFRTPAIKTAVQPASHREGVAKKTNRKSVIKASTYQDVEAPAEVVPMESAGEVIHQSMPEQEYSPYSPSSSCSSCDSAGHLDHPHTSFALSPYFTDAGSMQFMPMDGADSCCPPSLLGRMLHGLSVRLEATTWDRSAQDMPILVTTSPVGTDATLAGQIGRTTTSVLFGGSNVNDKPEGGGRLTLGTWLDDCRNYGLTFRGWDAGTGDTEFFTSDATNAIIARPFLDFTNGLPAETNAQLIAFPSDTAGNVRIVVESEIGGGDLALRRLLCAGPNTRWDMLFGYQFAQLNESLDIRTSSTVIDPNSLLFGTTIEVNDFFRTRNQFQGFEIGLQGARRYGCWYYEGMFKLGLGNMERTVTINGQTTVTSVGGTTTDNQGLLARFSNDGHYISDTFVVVPELGLNIGYALTNNLDITLGYTAIGLPNVAQAAAQIDPQLGSNLSDPLAGELRPSFVLTESNYWLSGFSYGLQYRY